METLESIMSKASGIVGSYCESACAVTSFEGWLAVGGSLFGLLLLLMFNRWLGRPKVLPPHVVFSSLVGDDVRKIFTDTSRYAEGVSLQTIRSVSGVAESDIEQITHLSVRLPAEYLSAEFTSALNKAIDRLTEDCDSENDE